MDDNGDGQPEGVLIQAKQIVLDEDVLSFGMQASIEQVGSATGVFLSFALLCAMLPRAGRLLEGLRQAPARATAVTAGPGESRESRDLERRAQDATRCGMGSDG